jgi:hypothetical protein
MSQTKYDPEKWLETTIRAIKDYVENNINTRIYEVVMEFPAPLMEQSLMPLSKTVIHFEIDDMPENLIGMGDNVFAANYNEVDETVNPQEAREQRINFDVGIWASDKSGGTTSRMRAKQILSSLFGGSQGIKALYDAGDNDDGSIEIIRYGGGRFAIDTINDVRVYRMVDAQLEVRVFSRTPISSTPSPSLEDFDQNPNITVIG